MNQLPMNSNNNEHDNELDGCDVEIKEEDATSDEDLPQAIGGVE